MGSTSHLTCKSKNGKQVKLKGVKNIKSFNFFRKKEKRQTLEEILIQSGIITSEITKEQALNIPSVSGCLDLICNTIASLPIVLYQEKEKNVEKVEDDERVALFNDDSKDVLDGFQLKSAMISDYLLYGPVILTSIE